MIMACLLTFLLAVSPPGPKAESPLRLSIEAVPSEAGAGEPIRLIATVTNTGTAVFETWGLLQWSRAYEPSYETCLRMLAIRDSMETVVGPGPHYRCYPGPAPPAWGSMPTRGPLQAIVIPPGGSYTDTLRTNAPSPEYARWPGSLVVTAEFLTSATPGDSWRVRNSGEVMCQIAIPVPWGRK